MKITKHKFIFSLLAGSLLIMNAHGVGNPRAADAVERAEGIGATEADYEWWREARFGVFLHWGPGAFVHRNALSWKQVPGRKKFNSLGYMADAKDPDVIPPEIYNGGYTNYAKEKGGQIPPNIYNNLYRLFDPVDFDADEFVQMAVDAGAGYVVFTTKHHDGFCMWDSAFTDYDMMSTPARRDICKELAEACHKHGLRLLWYYSKVDHYDARYDVTNPKAYDEYFYNQINELMTKYGDIEGIWWDGGRIKTDNVKLFGMMNRNHPGALSNGRVGKIPYGVSFGSPEQRIGSFKMDRPWETCAVTHSSSWIWNGGVDVKSATMGLSMLINAAGGDGNLLLNVAPTPSGAIIQPLQDMYLGMGKWLKKYGESIRKTRGGPYMPGFWGVSTRRANTIYLHITQEWPSGELTLPALPAKITDWEVLTGGEADIAQSKDGLIVKLNPKSHDSVDSIIKLTIDTDAMTIEPIKTLFGNSLTVDARVSASSSLNKKSKRGAPETVVNYSFETGKYTKHFGEESDDDGIIIKTGANIERSAEEIERIKPLVKAHRGHFWRHWSPKADDSQPWLAIDLGDSKTFSRVNIVELYEDIRGYQLQYKKNGKWKTFYQGDRVEDLSIQLAQPITAQEVRLLITKTSEDLPKISKFDLF